jgi:hypothetical protein
MPKIDYDAVVHVKIRNGPKFTLEIFTPPGARKGQVMVRRDGRNTNKHETLTCTKVSRLLGEFLAKHVGGRK